LAAPLDKGLCDAIELEKIDLTKPDVHKFFEAEYNWVS
jgi:hypothetical protein